MILPAHRAMQILRALTGITSRLGVTACAHHGHTEGDKSVAQRGALARAEDDPHLWKGNAQRADQLRQLAIAHGEARLENLRPRDAVAEG